MNKTINVTVTNKAAFANDVLYICGNSDFIVNFDFDDEWDEFDTKTARFIHNGQYTDVVFQGNQCAMPIISNTHKIYVGVFAGNLRTTTPAIIMAKKSILCGSGSPAAPSDDVYNQIMERIKNLGEVDPEVIASAVKEYMKENPVEGGGITEETDPTVPDWAKTALTAEVGQYLRVSAVAENGVVTAVETVDAPSGGGAGAEWELINEITTAEEVVSVEITTDTDGHPFDLLECEVSISIPSAPATAGAWYFYFTPGTTNYFMRTLTAIAQQSIVRYNALSNIASLIAQYSSGSVSVGAWPMNGHAVTEFRLRNWNSIALPVGTVIRLVGRRKT